MYSHHYQDLIDLFNPLFEAQEKTILVAHGTEPLYLPADSNFPLNRIIFRQDYFSSALHEVAHWCIAGAVRRTQVDYGYWYNPDGRNAAEQALFEAMEVKPQALEWIFSIAAKSKFTVSVDNLNGEKIGNADAFEKKISQQMQDYLAKGLPVRAALFTEALRVFYGKPNAPQTPPLTR